MPFTRRLQSQAGTTVTFRAEFIVRSGDVDGVGPVRGTITVCEYSEALAAGEPDV